MTKFESKFERLNASDFFQNLGLPLLSKRAAGAAAVSSQCLRQSQTIFLELEINLLCCACASSLTEQALFLSQESLFRQQAFEPF